MKVKLVAWFCVGYESHQVLFADGKVLDGMGPSQREPVTPPQQTLGELRSQFGDDSIGVGLPNETPAWLYGDDEEESNSFIVVEVTL